LETLPIAASAAPQGIVTATSSGPPRSLYTALLSEVRDAGLLRRRTGYYMWKVTSTLALTAGAWAAFVVLGNSWWQIGIAVVLAFCFTQLGFLGHDAGHQQVFRSRRANYVLGVLNANLAIGLSYGWWIDKHHRHHANPNHEDKDPDIGAGALAFTARQAENGGRAARALYRRQAYLFFPLLLLEGLNLHVASVRALMSRAAKRKWWEVTLFALHVVGYFGAVFIVLSPLHAVVFIAVQQGIFGLYLGCSFAPNHKGMPTLGAADRADFLRRQVLTSRNVRGNHFVDYVLGGLNYQIEHHLFPSMPRPNLRRSQPIISAYCRLHGVAYAQESLIASYAQALRHLNTVGRTPARLASLRAAVPS
jgi:fatty acid desaturase